MSSVDDHEFFELDDEPLTPFQAEFLAALRTLVDGRVRPYCAELDNGRLLLAVDIDAPDVALVSVGLELVGDRLRGDRISVHDRTYPVVPTGDGFATEGAPAHLAARAWKLIDAYDRRPIIRYEWLHRRRVYATSHVFEDTGERLADMYRSDWAPRGQERKLAAHGFVHGRGWIQTEGLGKPDRVVLVRGAR